MIKTDETICALAQKWQPSKRPRAEERSAKAVDTDMIVMPCVVRVSLRPRLPHASRMGLHKRHGSRSRVHDGGLLDPVPEGDLLWVFHHVSSDF